MGNSGVFASYRRLVPVTVQAGLIGARSPEGSRSLRGFPLRVPHLVAHSLRSGGDTRRPAAIESRPASPLECPAPAVHKYPSYPPFPHRGWGVISGPSEQPETPPARESEPPGEFVSENLRADCTRFLEELRALVRRRADLPAASTGWVPGPHQATADRDVETPPP